MKVILLEDVKKVGKKDDIVEVSQGYGNNFLIKNNKAVEADGKNLENLNLKLENRNQAYKEDVKKAEEVKTKLEREKFEFHLNSGKNGNVFGKISTKQIAKKLQVSGYDVDRKNVLSEGVNHLGDEKVKVKLHKEVIATINIEVIGD